MKIKELKALFNNAFFVFLADVPRGTIFEE